MQKADYLLRLMKQRTDALVASDEKLQQFLIWVNEKSLAVDLPYKPAAVRAFYFAVVRAFYFNPNLDDILGLDIAIDPTIDPAIVRVFDLTLDVLLDRALYRARVLALDSLLAPLLIPTLDSALDSALAPAIGLELRQALQELKAQLPNLDSSEKIFKLWWHIHGQAWIRQLKFLMISHRNMGHDWQFNQQQKELLKEYYDANKLLIDCLNNSNLSPEMRNEIEETLLLPTEMLLNAEG
jgi:predicted NACHT family NTPase